jgi:hypothetical protein
MSNEQLQLFDPDKIVKKRYPTVFTAEKRRLLEEAGEPWPVCDCFKKSGGAWKLRCTHLESLRRLRKTPGTYTYNEVHGIGKPGEVKKAKERRAYYTPGTKRYHDKMRITEQRMQKYIEGTEENKLYKEQEYAKWQMKLDALS